MSKIETLTGEDAQAAALADALRQYESLALAFQNAESELATAKARVAELEATLTNECSLRVQATDAAYSLKYELVDLRGRVARAVHWLTLCVPRVPRALEALRGR